MKNILIAILLPLTMVACKSKMKNKSVTLNVQSTEDYCGGAYPPDDLIKDLRTPKAYAGKLYLHSTADRQY
ncbi:MAG: hypothetical protein ACPGTP_01720, partial [Bacteroidia bacterium]